MPRSANDWNYVRDRYHTRVGALAAEYPDLVKADPVLAGALVQIRIAEMAIDARMAEIAGDEE